MRSESTEETQLEPLSLFRESWFLETQEFISGVVQGWAATQSRMAHCTHRQLCSANQELAEPGDIQSTETAARSQPSGR